ncbi:MAG: hypothetical protein KatS3mg105_4207 [Gemmatales bacterium]|nr:MAG: hypothetical protein KatS3mg105_4207 [Gemmatales bacterium]
MIDAAKFRNASPYVLRNFENFVVPKGVYHRHDLRNRPGFSGFLEATAVGGRDPVSCRKNSVRHLVIHWKIDPLLPPSSSRPKNGGELV